MSTEDSVVTRFLKIKLQICWQWFKFRDYFFSYIYSGGNCYLMWWRANHHKHKGLEMGRAQYQAEEAPQHLVLGTARDLSTPDLGLGVEQVCRSCCHHTALQTEQGYCLQVFRTHCGMGIWEMVWNVLQDVFKELVGMCETKGFLRVKIKGKNRKVKVTCKRTSMENAEISG